MAPVQSRTPPVTATSPALVFVMIQKSRKPLNPSGKALNTDESIVVIADEAHRSHSNTLHLHLVDQALPNSVRIGFTGTPIIMGARKRTHKIFGEFID